MITGASSERSSDIEDSVVRIRAQAGTDKVLR
jgi:hypothetical protein